MKYDTERLRADPHPGGFTATSAKPTSRTTTDAYGAAPQQKSQGNQSQEKSSKGFKPGRSNIHSFWPGAATANAYGAVPQGNPFLKSRKRAFETFDRRNHRPNFYPSPPRTASAGAAPSQYSWRNPFWPRAASARAYPSSAAGMPSGQNSKDPPGRFRRKCAWQIPKSAPRTAGYSHTSAPSPTTAEGRSQPANEAPHEENHTVPTDPAQNVQKEQQPAEQYTRAQEPHDEQNDLLSDFRSLDNTVLPEFVNRQKPDFSGAIFDDDGMVTNDWIKYMDELQAYYQERDEMVITKLSQLGKTLGALQTSAMILQAL